MPYYNEVAFLARSLASLKGQSLRPLCLILVDNASTDGSAALARSLLADVDERLEVIHLRQERPGQVHALEHGVAAVTSSHVAITDADTVYPEDYLATADRAFAEGGDDLVAVNAVGLSGDRRSRSRRLRRAKVLAMAALLPRQCHAGGYAHCFRTDALRAAGGYSHAIWPYVLKDHELMHRMFKQGRAVHPIGLWCRASDRRADRGGVRWSLAERLLYHATPFALKDWFFYRFLASRFDNRGLSDLKLRQRAFERADQAAPAARRRETRSS